MRPSEVESADPLSCAQHLQRGLALRARGEHEAAVAELRAACDLQPDMAEAHHQLGNALKSLRRHAEAASCLRRAAQLEPARAAVWLNLGVACLELGHLEESTACFRRAVELEPIRPEAWNILGHALLARGACTEARNCLEEALRLRPGYPAANDNLGRVLKAQGRAAEAVARHRAALAGHPRPETHSNLLYSLNFVAGMAPAEVAAEHRRWAELYETPLGAASGAAPDHRGSQRRLRIGYVSPDLVSHAVAFFFEPVLAAHNRSEFEITCYSDAPVPDAVTRRLQAGTERWRDIAGWSDERVAAQVRQDRIDILVDLAGHTARNRLLAFARKPAPVQVTWLGYPNTTGLKAMDFRLTDALSDPPGATEAWHSEELVRLPEAFSCYGPPPDCPPVGPLPALAAGHVTFGCCNNLAKVNDRVVGLWARILRDLAGARLVLVSRGLSDPETAASLRRDFAALGVAPGRIDCDGAELPLDGHLRRYGGIDIALDAFPYNGVTTTCEALWMGVPVVTLAGETHVSRVGASLLGHLGAPEWVADGAGRYAEICAGLAGDLPGLAAIRAGLRGRMRGCPLCDAPRFARGLEGAFRAMWGRGGRNPARA